MLYPEDICHVHIRPPFIHPLDRFIVEIAPRHSRRAMHQSAQLMLLRRNPFHLARTPATIPSSHVKIGLEIVLQPAMPP